MRFVLVLPCFAFLVAPAFAQGEKPLFEGAPDILQNKVIDAAPGAVDPNFASPWQSKLDKTAPYWSAQYGDWFDLAFEFSRTFTQNSSFATSKALKDSGLGQLDFSKGLDLLAINAMQSLADVTALKPYMGTAGMSLPSTGSQNEPLSQPVDEMQEGEQSAIAYGGASYDINQNWSVFSELLMDYQSLNFGKNDSVFNKEGNFQANSLDKGVNVGISLSF